MTRAIWILNDQCDLNNTALKRATPDDLIFMAESFHDLDGAFAHQKRTAFILAVNRSFSQTLTTLDYRVHVVPFQAAGSKSQLELLIELTRLHRVTEVLLMTPKDVVHREIVKEIHDFTVTLLRDSNLISDERIEITAFKERSFRMERFYQSMRKKTGLLMQNGLPIEGQFNFDQANQNGLKQIPQPIKRIRHPKSEVLNNVLLDVKMHFSHQLGQLEPFHFAITAAEAQIEQQQFIDEILPLFGHYQDNIVLEDAYLYHSLLSAYLNIGLLDPFALCQKVQTAYLEGRCSIASAEGFIRQVLGWREYIFYQYQVLMPHLEHMNFLKAQRPLPSFYWTAKNNMRCIENAVQNTLTHAYAHHIQRLMVLANFANLAQIDPFQVHQWFLGVYADAYAWVEMPNTLGMGLYADGGRIASKPYVSSAAYLHKMSNACESCAYRYKELLGEKACPFNALYWDYIRRHQSEFVSNPRMTMMVATYQKFNNDKKEAINQQAKWIFQLLDRSLL